MQPLDGQSGRQYQQDTCIHRRRDRTTIAHETGNSLAQEARHEVNKRATGETQHKGKASRGTNLGAHLGPLYVEHEASVPALLEVSQT